MMHHAKLILDLRQMPVTLGTQPVMMIGHMIEVNVEYTFKAGQPASDGMPAEPNVFHPTRAVLTRTLAMHDQGDGMSLIVGAGTDVLLYLSQLQLTWIEENLPVPEGA